MRVRQLSAVVLTAALVLMISAACSVQAENKLVNPGFEPPLGTIDALGSYGTTGAGSGWNYMFPDTESYIWSEAGQPCSRGCPQVRTGIDALRCHTSGNGSMMIWQDIAAAASAPYNASVWVSGVDFVVGEGFGASPTDSAGMWVQELDASNNVLVDHGKIAITTPTPYTLLASNFTTTSSTVKIRYMLHTQIGCPYTKGHVTYDDCVLDALPIPSSLEGNITSGGTAIEGATVTVGSKTATTNAAGFYSIADMAAGETVSVRASKDGYFAQRKTRVISGGVNTVDFDLTAVGFNILRNPGFDDGWQDGVWMSQGQGELESYMPEPRHFHAGEQAGVIQARNGNQAGKWYQTTSVLPGTAYQGACRFYGVGPSWGVDPNQVAALYVEELDGSGGVVVTHPMVYATSFAGWQHLNYNFTTSTSTSAVRIGGYTYLVDAFNVNEGRTIFDSFELNGPAGVTGLSGTVTGGGSALEGASVTATGLQNLGPVTTDAAGYYEFVGITGVYTARANKYGYYAQQKSRSVVYALDLDFDLVGKGNNLLLNAGFDDGWNAGWSTELGSLGVPRVEPETNTAAWTTAVYYHSGEQAVFIANDYGGDAKCYQSVPVQPGTQYEAAAMFKAAWKPGLSTSWGSDPNQKAGLYVAEYDSSGALIVEHPVVWATDFANWQRLNLTFTTSVNAATVRVGGYANLVDDYTSNLGRAVFDSMELNGPSAGVGSVKNLADGTAVSLTDKAVTAAFDGFFYIEEMDRSSGIRVSGSAGVGDAVSISGSISTIDGEKVVVPNTLIIGGSAYVPGPLGTNNKATGIGYGLDAVGLYIVTWGVVQSVGTGDFTISDGSGVSLKVYSPVGYTPIMDDYVRVECALGAELDGSSVVPVARAVTVDKLN